MEHEVTWEPECGCVRFTIRGRLALEHARALTDRAEQLFAGKERRHLLVDHTQSTEALPAQTRDFLRDRITGLGLDKVALFGFANVLRITAKLLAAITGHSDRTRFFKTEAEARAWLAE